MAVRVPQPKCASLTGHTGKLVFFPFFFEFFWFFFSFFCIFLQVHTGKLVFFIFFLSFYEFFDFFSFFSCLLQLLGEFLWPNGSEVARRMRALNGVLVGCAPSKFLCPPSSSTGTRFVELLQREHLVLPGICVNRILLGAHQSIWLFEEIRP